MDLALILTARCNASCTHCCSDSGPHKREALATGNVLALMDEAARLTPPGERLHFGLTGGEPFLDLAQLAELIRHGMALGALMTCVTNGFWASSEAKADAVIRRIRESGLEHLGVSTSRYHQQFVPLERVGRAVFAAKQHGMTTQLKIAYSAADQDGGLVAKWSEAVGADEVHSFPLVPYLRQGASLPESDYVRSPGLPEGRCPASILTVRENGAAYTCCNPGGTSPLLEVGNVLESGLAATLDRYRFEPVLQVLRGAGPAYLARAAVAAGHGSRLREAYAEQCDLCAHIASDPVLSAIARDAARDYRKQWADSILDFLSMQTNRRTVS